MKIKLKRIKYMDNEYANLKERILSDYEKKGQISVSEEEIDNVSEDIIWKDKCIYIDVDMDSINEIAKSEMPNNQKNAAYATLFQNIFNNEELNLPTNLVYDRYLWTYLNLTFFKKAIYIIYFEKDVQNCNKKGEDLKRDKVERYYFNECDPSKLDRTGFRFNWYMGEILDAKNHEERCKTAFEFIDSVKAIGERTLSNNYDVLNAYVDAIIKNNKNSKFKDKELRKVIPAHINCCAAVLMYDAYEYDELVDIIADEQMAVIQSS